MISRHLSTSQLLLLIGASLLLLLPHSDACWELDANGQPVGSSKIEMGTRAYVCVTLGPFNWVNSNDTMSYIRVPSKVKVDELSEITVKNGWTSSNYSEDATMYRLNISYATAATSDTGIYGGTAIGMALAVQIHGVSSMQRAFRYSDLPASPGSGVTFPLNTAIIKIKMGVVEEILWDNTCTWCPIDDCALNTYDFDGTVVTAEPPNCFVPDTECHVVGTNDVSKLCDLSVRILWTGTDASGRSLLSAASRLSRLRPYQLVELTDNLAASTTAVHPLYITTNTTNTTVVTNSTNSTNG